MASLLRIGHFGLGPIGVEAARLVARRGGMVSTAAVDLDPAKIGRDLAEVAGLDSRMGVVVRPSIAEALAIEGADVVLHATGSSLRAVGPQIEELLRAGVHVVSSCEELSFPIADRAGIGAELAAVAREKGVALLGTGINPGFAMDALPIFLTTPCQEVTSIAVTRVNDAGKRRRPLQKKVGAGLSRAEFQELVDAGRVRHVGLRESLEMIADAMGWRLERVEETTAPVLSTRRVATDYLVVEEGQVAGVHQVGVGYVGGKAAISLELRMYVGAEPEFDEVRIEGHPSLRVRCDGGFPGDITTAAVLVNAAQRLPRVVPGLWTMKDLPPAHYRS